MSSEQKLGPKQQAWMDALKSGEYKKTKGVLHTENGFCCLGVACDLRDREGWEKLGMGTYRFMSCSSYMPEVIMQDLALLEKGHSALMRYNDTDNLDFTQIADIITHDPFSFFYKPR